jgi:predicted GIY-YIG superfamily endonuclease
MSKLVSENFSDTKLIVAFKPPSDLGKQFPFKDKVDQETLVVYHIKCKNCNANYIGKTLRNINKRISEHQTRDTAISRHAEEHNHEFDFENVEIIDKADNNRQLELKEMLHIRKHRPTLNTQENSELFTLIIRNVQKANDITCDRQRYVNKKTSKINRK